jgi:hypothetical protein
MHQSRHDRHDCPDTAAERRKLRRVLVGLTRSSSDLCDGGGRYHRAIAVGGGQTFTWLVVLFVTFVSALASAELGAAIPEEGGAYVWPGPAGTLAALTSLLYWAGRRCGSAARSQWWRWRSISSSLAACRWLYLYLFGAVFGRGGHGGRDHPVAARQVDSHQRSGDRLLAFFTISVILYGTRKEARHSAADLTPSPAVFIAIVPVLLYFFVGVELPSTAAEEMINPRRDIPVAICRAGIGQALMYGVPILAILIVLLTEQITSLHGLIDAIQTVLTGYGGQVAADGTVTLTGLAAACWACAIVFIWVLVASGSAWIMGAGRAQAAACLDGVTRAGKNPPRSGVPVIMAWSPARSPCWRWPQIRRHRKGQPEILLRPLVVSITLIVLAYLLIFPALWPCACGSPTRPALPGPRRRPRRPAGHRPGNRWSALAAICPLWPESAPLILTPRCPRASRRSAGNSNSSSSPHLPDRGGYGVSVRPVPGGSGASVRTGTLTVPLADADDYGSRGTDLAGQNDHLVSE